MFSLTKIVAAVGLVATSAVAFTGDLTHYDAGLGACGWTNTASDMIVALAIAQYGTDANPNNAAVCGKQIAINYNGKTVVAEVVDKCWGCASGDIDVSNAVFSQLTDLGVGRVQVTWDFI
ncbi:hypothetical protein SLS62_007225 [Diatrype stigma]|uniref:Barwin domain-containing protein n=1 Tax=Diatrype stigma TaxID=117547 RepID=A0AAN9UPL1_9PEZI